jgi:hypothetical protein
MQRSRALLDQSLPRSTAVGSRPSRVHLHEQYRRAHQISIAWQPCLVRKCSDALHYAARGSSLEIGSEWLFFAAAHEGLANEGACVRVWATAQSLENEVCAKTLLSRALGLVPGRIRWHLRREVFATTDPSDTQQVFTPSINDQHCFSSSVHQSLLLVHITPPQ